MSKPTPIAIGTGATVTVYTDRYAATVIASTPSTVTLRKDKAIRIDDNGMSECQDYRYEPDPNGTITKATRRTLPNGEVIWKTVGVATTERGGRVTFGERRTYHDFSF